MTIETVAVKTMHTVKTTVGGKVMALNKYIYLSRKKVMKITKQHKPNKERNNRDGRNSGGNVENI